MKDTLTVEREQSRLDTSQAGLKDITSRRLILNTRLAVESMTGSEIVVFDFDTNARFKVTPAVHELACKFEKAACVRDVISGYSSPDHLVAVISNLVDKGILVDDGVVRPEKPTKLVASPHTLFNSPRWHKGVVTNVSVVGIPFDLCNTVAAGARGGPNAIRICSRQYDYRLDFHSGQPVGWFDLDAEERILEGVTFSDWGDLSFSYGENLETIFQRLAAVCADMTGAGSFPLFLGGDHSVTYPIVECLQRDSPLSVIWCDAHNDLGALVASASHDHGNVVRRILGLPNISRIVQIGLKGYTVYRELDLGGEKVVTLTASRLRNQGIASVLDALPASDKFYLSIDIDVLDPIHAPGTSTPVPGGLSLEEFKRLLSTIGLNRDVVGVDLVEVNPEKDHDNATSRAACQLLLASMGAITNRRRGSSAGL